MIDILKPSVDPLNLQITGEIQSSRLLSLMDMLMLHLNAYDIGSQNPGFSPVILSLKHYVVA